MAHLRAAGQLVEGRMDELRFSAREAAAFFKLAPEVHLADGDVIVLHARTEGWIAGLQKAATSLRGREDAGGFTAAFAGSHRFVSDYLLEEVFNRQTPEVRLFLLKTSVLQRLSVSVCEAVAETGGSARRLLDQCARLRAAQQADGRSCQQRVRSRA